MVEAKWRSRRQLEAAGLSKAAIDGLIRSRQVKPVVRGVFLPLEAIGDLWQLCGAALSTQDPDAVISRRTAAVAHDFPWVPKEWSRVREICVDAPRVCTKSDRVGLDRQMSWTPPEDVVSWSGLRVHSVARTAVDLAREGRVASPRETHTRVHIVDAGLPIPDVNLEIKHGWSVVAQGDLGYWRWLIWIEYDGEEYHVERRFDGRDQRKDRWLGRRGWEVMRLTNEDFHRPAAFLAQLAAAIDEAPARIAAMDPCRSPEVGQARRLLGLS